MAGWDAWAQKIVTDLAGKDFKGDKNHIQVGIVGTDGKTWTNKLIPGLTADEAKNLGELMAGKGNPYGDPGVKVGGTKFVVLRFDPAEMIARKGSLNLVVQAFKGKVSGLFVALTDESACTSVKSGTRLQHFGDVLSGKKAN